MLIFAMVYHCVMPGSSWTTGTRSGTRQPAENMKTNGVVVASLTINITNVPIEESRLGMIGITIEGTTGSARIDIAKKLVMNGSKPPSLTTMMMKPVSGHSLMNCELLADRLVSSQSVSRNMTARQTRVIGSMSTQQLSRHSVAIVCYGQLLACLLGSSSQDLAH
ncbi:hypothetical protein PR202_gb05733 [Eleusine coracana subsp. coracana]|uniref:Uncharacterized protein n=1 Tax=Eleusine coracana subsp. coracana TaxID=191504 RepID=A0AAV5E7P6_ELECO|nr:hypothetical protein PR202_gb05733 [Eleusine coracana subsp. coracana]